MEKKEEKQNETQETSLTEEVWKTLYLFLTASTPSI